MKYRFLALIFCTTLVMHAQSQGPNILWIVCEDISPMLSMYGDDTAKTPHLDKLSEESLVFDNAFASVGVCAPARSSIITGMYPTSIGTMHMRTGKDVHSWGKRTYEPTTDIKDLAGNTIPQYAAVVPDDVKCFTEHLRKEGYYCTNNAKTDYQFAAPISAWDENNNKAHWRNRPENTPFFSVFNFGITHESQIWRQKGDLTVNPETVKIPPYLQDTEQARHDFARVYSNIELLDAQVGKLIQQLKDDGLYDSTIIFFYSDHGGPLPRGKRAILDSGLKVPFMVKGINSEKTGRTDQLISFVDLAPTVLSLAQIKAPKNMQGKAFLGKAAKERSFVFASSDRFDEVSDRSRSVRSKQFLYVKNFHTDKSHYKDIAYRKGIPMMVELLELKEKGALNADQKQWFQPKFSEELYDCNADPFNLNNLAKDPEYAEQLKKHRKALDQKNRKFQDLGNIPESELIAQMWPNFEQPSTNEVAFKLKKGRLRLSCKTESASIAYILSNDATMEFNFDQPWQLYRKPIDTNTYKYAYVVAERIGFKISEMKRIALQ